MVIYIFYFSYGKPHAAGIYSLSFGQKKRNIRIWLNNKLIDFLKSLYQKERSEKLHIQVT